MKIVGRTDDGYLVQIREEEIAICAGFGLHARYGTRKSEWLNLVGTGIKTGTEINVVAAHSYLETLRENQSKAEACAAHLRQIADMITAGLPLVFIQPVEKGRESGKATLDHVKNPLLREAVTKIAAGASLIETFADLDAAIRRDEADQSIENAGEDR